MHSYESAQFLSWAQYFTLYSIKLLIEYEPWKSLYEKWLKNNDKMVLKQKRRRFSYLCFVDYWDFEDILCLYTQYNIFDISTNVHLNVSIARLLTTYIKKRVWNTLVPIVSCVEKKTEMFFRWYDSQMYGANVVRKLHNIYLKIFLIIYVV